MRDALGKGTLFEGLLGRTGCSGVPGLGVGGVGCDGVGWGRVGCVGNVGVVGQVGVFQLGLWALGVLGDHQPHELACPTELTKSSITTSNIQERFKLIPPVIVFWFLL